MFKKHTHAPMPFPLGAIADIVFLLLLFFILCSSLQEHTEGVALTLPQASNSKKKTIVKRNNILTITIDPQGNHQTDKKNLKKFSCLSQKIYIFLDNYGKDPTLAMAPQAVYLLVQYHSKTLYQDYLSALDKIQKAYAKFYAKKLGISYQQLHQKQQNMDQDVQKIHQSVPMRIILLPTKE